MSQALSGGWNSPAPWPATAATAASRAPSAVADGRSSRAATAAYGVLGEDIAEAGLNPENKGHPSSSHKEAFGVLAEGDRGRDWSGHVGSGSGGSRAGQRANAAKPPHTAAEGGGGFGLLEELSTSRHSSDSGGRKGQERRLPGMPMDRPPSVMAAAPRPAGGSTASVADGRHNDGSSTARTSQRGAPSSSLDSFGEDKARSRAQAGAPLPKPGSRSGSTVLRRPHQSVGGSVAGGGSAHAEGRQSSRSGRGSTDGGASVMSGTGHGTSYPRSRSGSGASSARPSTLDPAAVQLLPPPLRPRWAVVTAPVAPAQVKPPLPWKQEYPPGHTPPAVYVREGKRLVLISGPIPQEQDEFFVTWIL